MKKAKRKDILEIINIIVAGIILYIGFKTLEEQSEIYGISKDQLIDIEKEAFYLTVAITTIVMALVFGGV